MRLLVWQWGRHGAGPRFAAELARSLRRVPDTEAALSLAATAEILRARDPPHCDLSVRTYSSGPGFLARMALSPFERAGLVARLRALRPDVAVCAMPAPMDLAMAAALKRAGIPFVVVVHDADPHPGDRFPLQIVLQRALAARADALVALSGHVADRLRQQRVGAGRPLIRASLPPFVYGPAPPPLAHGGPFRLLSFGRLLPYKGLDLLADSLRLLDAPARLQVRVVGTGPEGPVLDALRQLPGVAVENRWVPEDEVGALIAWADGLVLTHREASQSGVAATAIAARRWLVATRVGGLAEQLGREPLALLCDPDAGSIVATLVRLLELAGHAPPPAADAQDVWQDVAGKLVADIAAVIEGSAVRL